MVHALVSSVLCLLKQSPVNLTGAAAPSKRFVLAWLSQSTADHELRIAAGNTDYMQFCITLPDH